MSDTETNSKFTNKLIHDKKIGDNKNKDPMDVDQAAALLASLKHKMSESQSPPKQDNHDLVPPLKKRKMNSNSGLCMI